MIDLSRDVTLPVLPLYIGAVTAVLVTVLELFTNDWRKLTSSFVMKETQSLIVTAGGILVFLALLSVSDVAAWPSWAG